MNTNYSHHNLFSSIDYASNMAQCALTVSPNHAENQEIEKSTLNLRRFYKVNFFMMQLADKEQVEVFEKSFSRGFKGENALKSAVFAVKKQEYHKSTLNLWRKFKVALCRFEWITTRNHLKHETGNNSFQFSPKLATHISSSINTCERDNANGKEATP